MNTTYADISEGKRANIEIEFCSQRTIDCRGGRVHRLLVTDRDGRQFAVLVTPDSHPIGGFKTGATYRISGLLGADSLAGSDLVGAACPDCEGRIRTGQAVDAAGPAVTEAVVDLALDEPFGIIDGRTSVRRVPKEEERPLVDDWRPLDGDSAVDTPDYVCADCGRRIDAYKLDDEARPDHSPDHRPKADAITASVAASPDAAGPETVGLAAGGAKDVTNFRQNVADGYTPQPEAIADEGLFYDYHFETGDRTAAESAALFAPRYTAATTDHPIDGTTERYLSIGLDSTLAVDAFDRPRLELVAVLDVSGSMDSPFNAYYYDEQGTRQTAEDDATSKLEAATRSLCALTEHLAPEDRLGVVLYNHRAHVAKPLRDVETTDMPAIRRHIREVGAGGSTNLADGFDAALDMLVDAPADPDVERRIVLMTDMMPNMGPTGDTELTRLFADAAGDGIHTTFVGIGLDANAALAETLSGIRGANHYFVHSAAEFERRLGAEFDYMVTPLVYDLHLDIDVEGYEVAAVHGSPTADAATGRLVDVGTLFPVAKDDGEARGGVVLVRLERTTGDAEIDLVASWTERDGANHAERVTVDVPETADTFTHDGVRKAVALARYARELRTWAGACHDRGDGASGVDDWQLPDRRGRHERESVPLVVPDRYADRFEGLQEYLTEEMAVVGDESMQREVDLLETLCGAAPATEHDVTDPSDATESGEVTDRGGLGEPGDPSEVRD